MATLINKVGSSYRKEGALMFVSPSGKTIGALSGGCLEKDIVHQAHRVSVTKKASIIEYDSLEDDYHDSLDDKNPMANTGCAGKIQILLSPITKLTHQELKRANDDLNKGMRCRIKQSLPHANDHPTDSEPQLLIEKSELQHTHTLESVNGNQYSLNTVQPRPSLLIIGAGHDAVALCQIATHLGWYVHLWDERVTDTKLETFAVANRVDNSKSDSIADFSFLAQCDGVILKSHNMRIDSFWLSKLETYQQHIHYIGMLGPKNRKNKIITMAGLKDKSWAETAVFSPAGFDIGGDTPESIALSILSQAQSVFSSSRN